MKLLLTIIGLLSLSLALPAFGMNSRVVPIAINDAFVPGGFDSESDAYVIASGIFMNGCYQWREATVEHQDRVHLVRSFANVSQGMCLMVLVPFTKEISLGKLERGNHQIRFINGDGTYMEKSVSVE